MRATLSPPSELPEASNLDEQAFREPAELEAEILDEPDEEPSSLLIPEWALHRARSGARWLDSKFGPDWDRQIDFARLDIGSPIWCIVGQLIRHGYISLIFATNVVEHGFSRGLLDVIVLLLPLGIIKRGYHPLTEAWKAVLNERRGPREPHVKRDSSIKRARQPEPFLALARGGDFTQVA